jgi:hypothetical protein
LDVGQSGGKKEESQFGIGNADGASQEGALLAQLGPGIGGIFIEALVDGAGGCGLREAVNIGNDERLRSDSSG